MNPIAASKSGPRLATLRIADHTLELPEEDALRLFTVAAGSTRIGGTIVLNEDTMVVVSPGTTVSITSAGYFADQCDPAKQLETITKRLSRNSTHRKTAFEL